ASPLGAGLPFAARQPELAVGDHTLDVRELDAVDLDAQVLTIGLPELDVDAVCDAELREWRHLARLDLRDGRRRQGDRAEQNCGSDDDLHGVTPVRDGADRGGARPHASGTAAGSSRSMIQRGGAFACQATRRGRAERPRRRTPIRKSPARGGAFRLEKVTRKESLTSGRPCRAAYARLPSPPSAARRSSLRS